MRAKAFLAVVLVALVSLLVVVSPVVLAQGPGPGAPLRDAVPDNDVTVEGVSPAVALGQPGLSYRYDRTYGETLVPYLADTDHLFRPGGVAVDTAGNVYVTERTGQRMLKYASDGTFLLSVGQAGVALSNKTNRLSYPMHLVVDSGGAIWIAENGANRVSKWSSTGAYVTQLGSGSSGSANDRLRSPEGVALDETRGLIYVADTGNHRVQVFTSAGVYTATIGSTGSCGTSASQFCYPRGVAVDGSGRLYVADSNNHRVQVFDSDRNLLATLGTSGAYGSANDQFNSPYDVDIRSDGALFVADRNNSRVQVFSAYPAFGYLATAGQGHCGSANDHFCGPYSLALTAAGAVYVADESNMRVQAFNSSLAYQRTFGVTGVAYLTDNQHFETPNDVTIDASGNLIILEGDGQRFVKMTPDGTALFSVGSPGVNGSSPNRFCWPSGVATDSGGRIYVADSCNYYVQIYGANGSYLTNLGSSYGTGEKQFKRPYGVAVAPDGKVYVADRDNHRVQVYGPWPAFTFLGTLGVTGVSGTGSNTFNSPNRVAVDGAGNIYVADTNNHRIQKCTLGGGCTTFAGVTGSAGNDFGRLNSPTGIAVDSQRVYVADRWNYRIQIFDLSGAYLTSIGGYSGQNTGRLQEPWGVAVDAAGNVYVTEYQNHRVQRFAPGVPGWVQTNINGFGERANGIVSALAGFGGLLYGGTYNAGGGGAQVWRSGDGVNWTPVVTSGFGVTRNVAIDHLAGFNGNLYAGTWAAAAVGGEVWRTPNGLDWTRVVSQGFGDPTNGEVIQLAVFSDTLYASTWSYTSTHGTEVWRSASGGAGDWALVSANGFGDANNTAAPAMAVFNGAIYAGTYNLIQASSPVTTTGGEVWRSTDGTNWTQINADGFGDRGNYSVSALAPFDGWLYAATIRWSSGAGGQVWRCQTCDGSDWDRVATSGLGNTNNGNWASSLVAYEGRLYLVFYNWYTGMEVWRTSTGTAWEKVGYAGFGDSNNLNAYFGSGVAVYNNRLYIGTDNGANGGEIWKKTVTAGFTASLVAGPPPLNVSFANQSAGDFTTTLWDFGDGVTSATISPTHEYTRTGVYTVTLTVGDGVDTSVVTRTAYVRVGYRAFLPLVLKTYDALLYDNFDDPAWDGAYNPGKWLADSTATQFQQQGGVLVVTEPSSANPTGGTLRAVYPKFRRWGSMQQAQARVKVSSNRTGGWTPIQLGVYTDEVNGHGWFANCTLAGMASSDKALASCSVFIRQGNDYPSEYNTPTTLVDYDTWHTFRIEADSITGALRFYLDDSLIGGHTPTDAAALVAVSTLQVGITAWGVAPNSAATRYVDDVRITLVQP